MSRDTAAAAMLVREGEYWTVVFDGRVSRVRDAKGMRYLDVLVHHPGEEIPALALVAAVEGNTPAAGRAPEAPGRAGDAGPVLDGAAIAAYRRRAGELREELDEAETTGDGERVARARFELDALTDQLAGGVGMGGRSRRAGAPAERARLAVTKAIRSALAKLEEADPGLGRYLDRTIRTGTSCAYLPDPRAGVRWEGASAASTYPAVAGVEDRTAVPPALPFVGRMAEARLLQATLDAVDARAGGRLLLIAGEAGIGKSRLVQEAVAEAARRGRTVLVGRCLDADAAVPWGPVVEMVDQIARQHPDDSLRRLLGAEAPEVARLLPSLVHRLPGLAPPAELPPAEARRFLERSVAEVLIRVATSRPVLAVFEDLHWCDPTSLAVLERLVDRLGEAPLALVVTCRPEEPGLDTPPAHAVERLLRSSACVPIRLRPLERADVAELAIAVGGGPADSVLVERLSAETGGNPLFVVEMLKHLKDEGRLGADGHGGGDMGTGVDLPASLRLVIGHRLRRLSSEAREVLTTTAVVGRDVDDVLLQATQPFSEEALVDAVDEAIRARLLVPVAGATDADERLRFVHALVRHAVLAELTPMRRRRVHRAVADSLLRLRGADPDAAAEIADHLDAGHSDRTEAARFHQRAARRALERFAYEDAASRLDRALDLAPAEDEAWRAQLLTDRGAARRSLGQIEETLADWSEAVRLLEAQGPSARAQVGALCVELATTVDVIGRLDEAVAFARRGLAVVGTAPTPERSRLLAALGYALGLHGEHVEAEECLTEAAAIADGLDDPSLRGRALAARTSFEFIRAGFPACLRFGREAFDTLVGTGELWHGGQALLTSFIPCVWMGRFDEGLARAEVGTPVLRRVGHLAALCWDARLRYMIELARTGGLDAFAAATDADVELCRVNRLRWLADAQVLAGTSSFWRGDWDTAAAHLEAAAAMPTPGAYVGRYTASLLCFTAWRGDADRFDRLVAAHQEDLSVTGVLDRSLGRMAFALAELEGQVVLGRRDRAAALYPAALDALARQVVLRPMDIRLVEVLAALAAAAGDDWPAAERHLAQAREQVDTLPQRREEPDLDRFEALVLTWRDRSGDRRRAQTLLERAVKGYRTMGMPRHAELAAASTSREA